MCHLAAPAPEIEPLKQPHQAHAAETLADSVRTGSPYIPSDLRKRFDSHVEAELHDVAV